MNRRAHGSCERIKLAVFILFCDNAYWNPHTLTWNFGKFRWVSFDEQHKGTLIKDEFLMESEHQSSGGSEPLAPLVYQELRRIADRIFQRERPGHTLQPTAVINEAYIRLAENPELRWQSRSHFLAVTARAFKRVLIDYARERHRVKRGGNRLRVTLDEAVAISPEREIDFIDLDEALEKLATLDHRQAQVVELRFFGGMTVAEVADVLQLSKRSVEKDWAFARAWLHRELSGV